MMRAFDPARGIELEPPFGTGGAAEVDNACRLSPSQRSTGFAQLCWKRVRFFSTIAENFLALAIR
jgi:NADP-dependent aldehyde dehydrogenase